MSSSDWRPAISPATTSWSSCTSSQSSTPALRPARRGRPTRACACSSESQQTKRARSSTALSSSRRVTTFAPAARDERARLRATRRGAPGSRELVIVTTTSVRGRRRGGSRPARRRSARRTPRASRAFGSRRRRARSTGQRRADARDLRLRLVAAADDAERRAPLRREVPRRDAARRAGPQLPEPVGLDHRDELRRLGVEEADDERRAVRGRRVELPAGEPELAVGSRHVRERALGQPEPAPRRDLDLARAPSAGSTPRRPRPRRPARAAPRRRLGQVERHASRSLGTLGATAVDSSLLTPTTTSTCGSASSSTASRPTGSRPGGGSAAALTVAFAARLVGDGRALLARTGRRRRACARRRTRSASAPSRSRSTDGRAWEEALAALRDAEAGGDADPRRDFALEQKLEAAAAAPLEIASLGADAAALAALAGEHGDATYRADAAAAAALAAGGAAAAAHLVRVNLGVRDGRSAARPRARERAGGARRRRHACSNPTGERRS